MAQAPGNPAKPTIGITMGDPSGVGPEVAVKALHDRRIRGLARFVVYGLNELMAYAADQLEIEPYWFRVQHDSGRTARRITENVVVLDFDEFDGFIQSPRQPSKSGGVASKTFVEEAICDAITWTRWSRGPSARSRGTWRVSSGPATRSSWPTARRPSGT
ncbi:MAG: hypothetical protein ACYTAQ_06645 [Planctomycetota bacterium]